MVHSAEGDLAVKMSKNLWRQTLLLVLVPAWNGSTLPGTAGGLFHHASQSEPVVPEVMAGML